MNAQNSPSGCNAVAFMKCQNNEKADEGNTQICLSTGPIELHVPMNRIIWGLNLFRQKFWDRLRGTLQQMKDVGLTIYKNAY